MSLRDVRLCQFIFIFQGQQFFHCFDEIEIENNETPRLLKSVKFV